LNARFFSRGGRGHVKTKPDIIADTCFFFSLANHRAARKQLAVGGPADALGPRAPEQPIGEAKGPHAGRSASGEDASPAPGALGPGGDFPRLAVAAVNGAQGLGELVHGYLRVRACACVLRVFCEARRYRAGLYQTRLVVTPYPFKP